MTFFTEPKFYEKTILSDLQGAWQVLLESVADNADFKNADKMIFHIHEAMSWENVRNLKNMKSLLNLIRNIAMQNNVTEEILENIQDVSEILDEVLVEKAFI